MKLFLFSCLVDDIEASNVTDDGNRDLTSLQNQVYRPAKL